MPQPPRPQHDITIHQQLLFAQVQYATLLSSGPPHRTTNKAQRLAELRQRMDRLEAQLQHDAPRR